MDNKLEGGPKTENVESLTKIELDQKIEVKLLEQDTTQNNQKKLKELLSQIVGEYFSAGQSLDDFKVISEALQHKVSEKPALSEALIKKFSSLFGVENTSIDSKKELLRQKPGIAESIEYRERGADLREKVASIADLKAELGVLVDGLEWRGGRREGEEKSAREISIEKIKTVIETGESDGVKITEEIARLRDEAHAAWKKENPEEAEAIEKREKDATELTQNKTLFDEFLGLRPTDEEKAEIFRTNADSELGDYILDKCRLSDPKVAELFMVSGQEKKLFMKLWDESKNDHWNGYPSSSLISIYQKLPENVKDEVQEDFESYLAKSVKEKIDKLDSHGIEYGNKDSEEWISEIKSSTLLGELAEYASSNNCKVMAEQCKGLIEVNESKDLNDVAERLSKINTGTYGSKNFISKKIPLEFFNSDAILKLNDIKFDTFRKFGDYAYDLDSRLRYDAKDKDNKGLEDTIKYLRFRNSTQGYLRVREEYANYDNRHDGSVATSAHKSFSMEIPALKQFVLAQADQYEVPMNVALDFYEKFYAEKVAAYQKETDERNTARKAASNKLTGKQ